MGNYHARFLGGKGVERPLLYPVVREDKSRPLDVDYIKYLIECINITAIKAPTQRVRAKQK
jgi:hypothetical protein